MIIKNCPAYREEQGAEGNSCYPHCKDIKDCILKQIAEICRTESEKLAQEILQIMGVEE